MSEFIQDSDQVLATHVFKGLLEDLNCRIFLEHQLSSCQYVYMAAVGTRENIKISPVQEAYWHEDVNTFNNCQGIYEDSKVRVGMVVEDATGVRCKAVKLCLDIEVLQVTIPLVDNIVKAMDGHFIARPMTSWERIVVRLADPTASQQIARAILSI